MPKGVYPRTANQLAAAPANLAKGRETAARKKANATLKEIAKDPAWRKKVSEGTRAALAKPEIKSKLMASIEGLTVNFKGGNGQKPMPLIADVAALLCPLGWIREYPIKTKGHGTAHNPPPHYKADFAFPRLMIVLEMDGWATHRKLRQQERDIKKTQVLQALGWEVIRVQHD